MPAFQAVNRHIRDLQISLAELKASLPTPSPSPVIPPESKPTRTAVKRNRKAEARIIDGVLDTFDEQELIDLSMELGVNYQAILGNGLRGKVTGVVDHFARHGILGELVNQLAEERPHFDWHGVLIDTSELK